MLDHYLHKRAFPKDYVAEQYERLMGEYGPKLQWAGVGGGRAGSGVNAASRVSRHCWVPREDPFVAEMIALVYHVNFKKFGFKLWPPERQSEQGQFTVYSGKDGAAHGREGDEQGGYYHQHEDCFMGDPMKAGGGDMRKLSTTLALNPESDYEGGEFKIHHTPIDRRVDSGQMICFPSFKVHEVRPVTKGVRASIVWWAHGPDFV